MFGIVCPKVVRSMSLQNDLNWVKAIRTNCKNFILLPIRWSRQH